MVEVLKLIHLLLAFPLFVCVAAVDPRWISRCLQNAPGLIDTPPGIGTPTSAVREAGLAPAKQGRMTERSEGSEVSKLEGEVGVPATAEDYLEKIFQIPLWLRSVPRDQRGAVARALLDPSEPSDEPRFDLPVTPSSKVAAAQIAPLLRFSLKAPTPIPKSAQLTSRAPARAELGTASGKL